MNLLTVIYKYILYHFFCSVLFSVSSVDQFLLLCNLQDTGTYIHNLKRQYYLKNQGKHRNNTLHRGHQNIISLLSQDRVLINNMYFILISLFIVVYYFFLCPFNKLVSDLQQYMIVVPRYIHSCDRQQYLNQDTLRNKIVGTYYVGTYSGICCHKNPSELL